VEKLYKFGFLNPDDQPYHYPNVWAIQQTSGENRLAIGPRTGYVNDLLRLIEAMPEPFWVLYVLVVPRGGSESGRYQSSEPQTREAVCRCLKEFEDFLELDGRHHFWMKSVSAPAMLVYDRHNLIYGYGPLSEFETILFEMGLEEGQTVQVPSSHVHHYNQNFDEDEHRILANLPWTRTPLREADDD